MTKITFKGGKAWTVFLGLVFMGIAGILFSTWVAMACFNWIHQDWPAVPALGYGATFSLLVLVNILGTAALFGNRSPKS